MKERIILAISIAGLFAALACTIGVRKAPNQHSIEVTEPPSITATVETTTPSRTPKIKPPTTYEQPKDEPQPTETKQTTQPPVTTTEPKPTEPKPEVTTPQTTQITTKPKPATATPTEKAESSTPKNGDTKDGYIYLNGLGKSKNARMIERLLHESERMQQAKNLNTPAYFFAMRLRKIWCEGNFAHQKEQHNLRRTFKRGIEKVTEQCLLSACALNLKRLVKAMKIVFFNNKIYIYLLFCPCVASYSA